MMQHGIHKLATLAIVAISVFLSGCAGNDGGVPTSRNAPKPKPPGNVNIINHIIFMLQENEAFDRYFGQMNNYRQSQGLSADVDVTPSTASQLAYDHSTSFTPFHMMSMCTEELSPFWNESHHDWNRSDPTSATPMMDGFAISAGNNSRNSTPVGFDINGERVMGYYDDNDLPYYYFMATQFAISDRWFSPVMTNTPANRMYALAATSQGVISKPLTQISAPTIFDELQKVGLTWKNYVPDYPVGSSLQPFSTYSQYFKTNVVPMSEYF